MNARALVVRFWEGVCSLYYSPPDPFVMRRIHNGGWGSHPTRADDPWEMRDRKWRAGVISKDAQKASPVEEKTNKLKCSLTEGKKTFQCT